MKTIQKSIGTWYLKFKFTIIIEIYKDFHKDRLLLDPSIAVDIVDDFLISLSTFSHLLKF